MLCSFFVRALQYLKRNAHEKWHTQIDFFPLLPWAAQMAQTEEFMFQNVACRPTVYKAGGRSALWSEDM